MAGPWNLDIAGQPGQPGGPPGSAGGVGPAGPAGPAGAGYLGTSTTNVPIATGSVTITTQAGLAYQVGARLRLSSNSAPTSWMEGLITAYNNTTGALTVNIDTTNVTVAGTTPGAGITDGSNAAAGMIGEYLFNSATVIQPQITTNTITDVTSTAVVQLTLTPGDWDVHYTVQTNGTMQYSSSSWYPSLVETSFANNAGTTSTFRAIADVISAPGLPPDAGLDGYQNLLFTNVLSGARLNVTANTLLSLNVRTVDYWIYPLTFTINAYLWARRVR